MDLLKTLQWRYATKRMNSTKVPQAKLDVILKAIQLAPSSLGLQPFKVIVVDSPAMLQKIHQGACEQPQVVECSQLILFAARENFSDKDMNDYIDLIAKTRSVETGSLDGFKSMIQNVQSKTEADYLNWSSRQCYIALGVGLVAAASEDVDATPMEGFDKTLMDEVLELPQKGLRSVVMMAVGYRDAQNDYLVNAKKVRKPFEDLFITV